MVEQEKLAAIWCKVLRLPEVAPDDNFFQLGGNSALLVVAVTMARRAGLNLQLKQAFEHSTLQTMARAAAQPQSDAAAPVREIVLGDSAAKRRAYVILTSGEDLPIINRLANHTGVRDVALNVLMPLWDESEPYRSPSALAPHFTERMVDHANEAGFVIIGHCSASPLAARIAVQLQSAGASIRQLILLDAAVPGEQQRGWALDEEMPADPANPQRLARLREQMARISAERAAQTLAPQEVMEQAWQLIKAELIDVLTLALKVDASEFADKDTLEEAAHNYMAWLNLMVGLEENFEQTLSPATAVAVVLSDASLAPEVVKRHGERWQAALGGEVTAMLEPGGHRALLYSDQLIELIVR